MASKKQENRSEGKEETQDSKPAEPNEKSDPLNGKARKFGAGANVDPKNRFLYYLSTRCHRAGKIITPIEIMAHGGAYQISFTAITKSQERHDWKLYLPQSALILSEESKSIQVRQGSLHLVLNQGFHIDAWKIPDPSEPNPPNQSENAPF